MQPLDTVDFVRFARELGVDSLEALDRFPRYFQIETVSGCNARCTMCSVNSWRRTNASMPQVLFDRIVDELRPHCGWIERVIVQQDGEPLLDRRLEEKITSLKAAGIRSVSFATNASLLDVARANALLDSGLDGIDFSMDGITSHTFERIRLNLSYDQCRDNILRFIELRNQRGALVQIRVRMVIQASNAHEFESFVEFWRSQLSTADVVFGKIEQKWQNWRQDLRSLEADYASESPDRDGEDFNMLPCVSPFDTLVVLSDGRVPLCCLDYNADVPMGNLYESTIEEIWRGEAFKRVRRLHMGRGRRAMSACIDCHNFVPGIKFSRSGARTPSSRGESRTSIGRTVYTLLSDESLGDRDGAQISMELRTSGAASRDKSNA